MATALCVCMVLCVVVCAEGVGGHRQAHNHNEGNQHNVGHPHYQPNTHGLEANRDDTHNQKKHHQLQRQQPGKQNHQPHDHRNERYSQKPSENHRSHPHPGDHLTTTPRSNNTGHHITIKPITDFVIRSPMRGCPSGQNRDWSGNCRPSF